MKDTDGESVPEPDAGRPMHELADEARASNGKPGPAKAQGKKSNGSTARGTSADEADSRAASSSPSPAQPRAVITLAKGTDEFTDLANAERFRALYGARSRWCDAGGWHCFDARRWARRRELAEKWAQETARFLMLDAQSACDAAAHCIGQLRESGDKEGAEQASKQLRMLEAAVDWARKTQSARGLAAMLRTAQCELTVQPDIFDPDPWLLNVENGTIDLRTGQLRPHSIDDMITKMAPVSYVSEAPCPMWESFLEQVQPDPEVCSLLRRLVGLSLTGSTEDHVLPINWGGGRNGKGVFMNTLMRIFGDGEYAKAVPTELLMAKRGEAHPTDKTVLFRIRLASATETEEGKVLNVALVKLLTGGDPITARRMREDFWTFLPTHKLWLATNHKPIITETKDAIWRRVLLIPWEVTIAEGQEDTKLEARLFQQEAAGILRWAVDACREYQKVGLAPPNKVRAETQTYRAEQDEAGAFIGDRCVLSEQAKITRGEIMTAYRAWAEEQGHEPMSPGAFAERLRERGILVASGVRGPKGYGERGWKGIRLKSRGEGPVDYDADPCTYS